MGTSRTPVGALQPTPLRSPLNCVATRMSLSQLPRPAAKKYPRLNLEPCLARTQAYADSRLTHDLEDFSAL